MNQRSWLFIPGGSEKKLGKADVSNAAAFILDLENSMAVNASCEAAAAKGFTGRIAIHPAQVRIINEAFAPSVSALEHARHVIAAPEAFPGIGTVALDGKMVDIPHLKQARNVLEMHRVYTTRSS